MRWSGSKRVVAATLAIALILAPLACGSDKATAPKHTISLSSAAVTFETEAGAADPASQMVEITNADTGVLTDLQVTVAYPLSGTSGWLTAEASASTTPSTLTLHASTASIPAGTYAATVTVAGAGANARKIPITLKVGALIGYTSIGSTFAPPAGYFYSFPVTVPAAGTLVSLGVIADGTAQIRIGLYSGSTAPTTLVAATPVSDMVAGRNDFPLNVAIAQGVYWIGFATSSTVSLRQPAGGVSVPYKFFTHTFSTPLPTTFPAADELTGGAFDIFMKVFVP